MAYNGPLGQVVNAGGTGQVTLTNHGVLVGAGTTAITQLAVGTNGQVLIGAAGADPAFASLTSSDSSITFTTGANTLSLQVAGGTTSIKTITGNSGGAESPSAGNFNILGTGSITVAGSANTETVQLTGLTNHAIQIGAGTATLTQLGPGTTGQVLQTNTTADPTWSTATYPSTTTINQLLYSSANNTVAGLTTANNGVVTTGTTGTPAVTALGTDGQLIIGSSAGAPTAATLTAGTGISISNGHNSITINNTGAGFTWNDVTGGSATMAAQNGYIADKSTLTTFTMPTNNALGDTIKVIGKGSGGWTIVYTTNQNIIFGSLTSTTTTGSLSSTNAHDCLELVCTTASASAPIFTVVSSIGNITVV